MIPLTQQERQVLIFLGAILCAGLCLELGAKGAWPHVSALHILDDPSFYPPLNVNQASLEDLLVGARLDRATAEKILLYRREKGRFQSMDELKRQVAAGERRWKSLAHRLKVR